MTTAGPVPSEPAVHMRFDPPVGDESGPFAAEVGLGPGGSLPMNTNGGGLSFTHPGMYGMFLITEAVRQLRGEADARQVDGAEVAVAHGSGMFLSVLSTAVLGTEAAL